MDGSLVQDFLRATDDFDWDAARPILQASVLAINDAVFRILNILADIQCGTLKRQLSDPCWSEETPKEAQDNAANEANPQQKHKQAAPLAAVDPNEESLERMMKDVNLLLSATLQKNIILGSAPVAHLEKIHQANREKPRPQWSKSTRHNAHSTEEGRENIPPQKFNNQRSTRSVSPASRASSSGPASTGYANQFSTRTHQTSSPTAQCRPNSQADFRKQKQELEQRIRGSWRPPEVAVSLTQRMTPRSSPRAFVGSRSSPVSLHPNGSSSRSESPTGTYSTRAQGRQQQLKYDLHGRRIPNVRSNSPQRWPADSDSESVEISTRNLQRHADHQLNDVVPRKPTGQSSAAIGSIGAAAVAVDNLPKELATRPRHTRAARPPPSGGSRPPVVHIDLLAESSVEPIVQSADPTRQESESSRGSSREGGPPDGSANTSHVSNRSSVPGLQDVSSASDAVRKILFSPSPGPEALAAPPEKPENAVHRLAHKTRSIVSPTASLPEFTGLAPALPGALEAHAMDPPVLATASKVAQGNQPVRSPLPCNGSLMAMPGSADCLPSAPASLYSHGAPFLPVDIGIVPKSHSLISSSAFQPTTTLLQNHVESSTVIHRSFVPCRDGLETQALALKESAEDEDEAIQLHRLQLGTRQKPYHLGYSPPATPLADVKYVEDVMAEIHRTLENTVRTLTPAAGTAVHDQGGPRAPAHPVPTRTAPPLPDALDRHLRRGPRSVDVQVEDIADSGGEPETGKWLEEIPLRSSGSQQRVSLEPLRLTRTSRDDGPAPRSSSQPMEEPSDEQPPAYAPSHNPRRSDGSAVPLL